MPKYATFHNASAIAECLQIALDRLREAEGELSSALQLARDDYKGNDAQLANVIGAQRIITGQVSLEASRWREYARARHDA